MAHATAKWKSAQVAWLHIDQGDMYVSDGECIPACEPWPGARTAAHHRASFASVFSSSTFTI